MIKMSTNQNGIEASEAIEPHQPTTMGSSNSTETSSTSDGSNASAPTVSNDNNNGPEAIDKPASTNSDTDQLAIFDELHPKEDGEDSATESLPNAEELTEETHDRSDGSDSGLGSELSEERPPVLETFFLGRSSPPLGLEPQPKKSNLKRKLDDDAGPKCKKKRGISFDNVTVYYFPRAQGFTCVPSQGGSTLGMVSHHSHVRKFTIVEHANEQRRIHRQLLQQLGSERNTTRSNGVISSDESDSDEEPSDASESEMDLDNYYFLQPVPTRQRRALLRAAGVRKIDSLEKDDCRNIRTSREFCGCGCKGYCDPDTCSCSQAGIKCQVDRLNFPCGCSRDNCGNSSGRIEFNPVRVRTHFIHTLMRLELEKKQDKEDSLKVEKTDWMDNERVNLSYQQKQVEKGKFNNEALDPQVENCVHDGSFTNLHYGAPGEGPGPFPELPSRADSLDLYTFREDCYAGDRAEDRKQYSGAFQFSDPRFSNIAFPAGASYASPPFNQYPQPYQSSFADFSPYGAVYAPEFQTKPLGAYDQQQFEDFAAQQMESKESQYTSLSPVGAGNKMESFSELLHGRYNYNGYNETNNFGGSDVSAGANAERVDKIDSNSNNSNVNNADCGENFGEIIKKSMVETVSA